MNTDVAEYQANLTEADKAICDELYRIISTNLPNAENKVWHGHPVWFLEGNPIVGYHKLKDSVRVLFWSGQSFEEPSLQPEGSFKAAELRYTEPGQIDEPTLVRCIKKSVSIQWDYKNIVKNKGVLHKL